MVANKDVDTNTDTYSEATLSAIASAKANITNRCGTLTNVVAVNLKKVQKLSGGLTGMSWHGPCSSKQSPLVSPIRTRIAAEVLVWGPTNSHASHINATPPVWVPLHYNQ